jgi:hypothetical protein
MAETKINQDVRNNVIHSIPVTYADLSGIHVDERSDAEAIKKTQGIANGRISPDVPGSFNNPLNGRVTLGSLFSQDAAREAIHLGLAKEQALNDEIQGHIQEVNKIHNTIDLLLKLTAELSSLKEEPELPEHILNLFEELKNEEIDFLKGDTALEKVRLAEIKNAISSLIDTKRSKSQVIFVTKIQDLMSKIQSLMPLLQDIIRQRSKLIDKTQQLPR